MVALILRFLVGLLMVVVNTIVNPFVFSAGITVKIINGPFIHIFWWITKNDFCISWQFSKKSMNIPTQNPENRGIWG